MFSFTPTNGVSSKPHLSPHPLPFPFPLQFHHPRFPHRSPIRCGIRELRERIQTVKNTQKITEAMKLVAAARVRRAQEAVVNGRPFSETLAEMLHDINDRVRDDDVEVPLCNVRPVKKVALVVVTGDRGLCGGFNNAVVKKAQTRIEELRKLGLDCVVISVGKKGNSFFNRRDFVEVDRFVDNGGFPTTKKAQTSVVISVGKKGNSFFNRRDFVEVDRFVDNGGFPTTKKAQTIADDVFSLFVSEEVDKVELVFTKFVSLVKFDPVIQTLLPLSRKGEVCDVNGNSVEAIDDEYFRLTSKDGKLALERDVVGKEKKSDGCVPIMEFEQDPVQILDAMMPLYLNSQILRSLQESLASELAARMGAMSNATDNAIELTKNLLVAYNRERQAKITGELLEIVAGAEALTPID